KRTEVKMALTACSYLLIAAFWLPTSPHSSVKADTSAEEIVAAYIEAIGGVDALKAVAGKRMTYRVHMFGREPYLMERTWTRPNSMQTGSPGATAYTLTEGERSWRVTPEGRQELPSLVAQSLARQADIDGPLVDPADKGVTLSYSGVVRYDMADLHQVTATFSDGVQWQYFFDASTGLLRRMTQPSFMMLNDQISRGPDAHYFYYDYRAVGGVLYPHLWIQSTDDHTHLFVVEDMQIRE
ncbi:MAG: hypothetical protein JSW71_06165, partial [Gemmatimonadota bacterium]